MNAALRLKYLVQLALVDHAFDDRELEFIKNLGKANKISEEEIDTIVKDGLSRKDFIDDEFQGLSFDQKFEYLVNIIELMKIDGKIYLSEINYCKDIAEKLGFKRNVISKVSSKIHSEASLSVDWDTLKEEIRGSLLER